MRRWELGDHVGNYCNALGRDDVHLGRTVAVVRNNQVMEGFYLSQKYFSMIHASLRCF